MQSKKKMIVNTVFLVVIFALTIYGVFHGEDLGAMMEAMRRADVRWLLPGLFCVVFFIWGESIIIWYMMHSFQIPVKKILLMAYDRSSIGKGILYRLVEVSVKMKDFDEAIDFYNEFEAVARHDNSRYLLKYKILRGQKAPLEEQISLLEEYKEREFTERWAYELANLYSKAGETQKCIDACDELILWFSEGKYVTKAMDLKMKYEPLSPSQQIKYEHRFDYKKNEEPSEDPEALEVRLAGESGAGEMAATSGRSCKCCGRRRWH